jgi:hypothetical protein
MVLAIFSVLGALSALAYTASLACNTRLYLSAGATGLPILLHVARTVTMLAVFVGLALAGAAPFLVAVLAFACAHVAAVFAMQRWA